MSSHGLFDDHSRPTAQELVRAALRAYMQRCGRSYLSWPDVLRVLDELGYARSRGSRSIPENERDQPGFSGPFGLGPFPSGPRH